MLAELGLLLVLTPPGSGQEPSDLPVLEVGETIEDAITDEDPLVHTEALDTGYTRAPNVAKAYWIQVEEAGPYHIDLRSYFFDGYLVLRGEGGAILAEDDDGPIGAHARIAAELAADAR